MDISLIFSSDDEEEEGAGNFVSEPDADTIYRPVFSAQKRRRIRNTFIDVEGEIEEEDEEDDVDEDDEVDPNMVSLNVSHNFAVDENELDDEYSEQGLSGLFTRKSASASEDEDYDPPVKYLANIDQKTAAPQNRGMKAAHTFDAGPDAIQAVHDAGELLFESATIDTEANVLPLELLSHSLQGAPPPVTASPSGQKIQAFFGSLGPQSVPAKRSGSTLLSSASSSHGSGNHALQSTLR